MPKSLENDIHINTLLVMLPYDADKVASYPVGLEINGKPAAKLDLSSPAGIKQSFAASADHKSAVVSFMGRDNTRVYYQLLADSDSAVKPADYSAGHDAAAFMEVDKTGKPIVNKATGKPNVIVTFPGLNDPKTDLGHAAQDLTGQSSYQDAFFNDFMSKLEPALKAHGLSTKDTQAISHSMGDKYALEYAARYGSENTMIIDGWDKKDAMVGAVLRNTLRENADKNLTHAQFETAFQNKLTQVTGKVVEINASKNYVGISTDLLGTDAAEIGGTAYKVEGAGHTAKNFMHIADGKLKKLDGISNPQMLAAQAFKEHYLSGDGFWSQSQIEKMFISNLENTFEAQGSKKESLEAKLEAVKDKLGASGIQVSDMQDAQRLYFKPKDPEAPITQR